MSAAKEMQRVLLLPHPNGIWVARWLEHDIVGQGTTVELAVRNLHAAVEVHAQLDKEAAREPFAGVPASPDSYREDFEKGVEWKPAAVETKRPAASTSWRFRRMEIAAQL